MPDDRLVLQPRAANVLSNHSATPSETQLAFQLHLTRVNAKAEADEFIDHEFRRVFARHTTEAIEWAFQQWREVSPYFPTVAEILELVREWYRRKAEAEREAEAAAEKKKLEEARGRGELIDFAELKQQVADIAAGARIPPPPGMPKRFNPAITTNWSSPAIPMTREQIAARRDAERAEIRRVLEEAKEDEA